MCRGFCYLIAISDWPTRAALFWKPSATMEADFGVEASEEALSRCGTPQIFDTDQRVQL